MSDHLDPDLVAACDTARSVDQNGFLAPTIVDVRECNGDRKLLIDVADLRAACGAGEHHASRPCGALQVEFL
ncbi:hypothetical protein, partial [Bradyrhizobium guangdongense]|uniref:hypothetical protein n=1 Tax=Bradyrhizobium guangdongense TaxID=1325090 RepID=UPI001FD940E2